MTNQSLPPAAEDHWNDPIHEKQKTESSRSDFDYPHYADLNRFIKGFATDKALVVLDYGAGASPYRKYFPNADYRRADITGAPNLNYQIGDDSVIAEHDECFDLILSTQVAEHLPQPDTYFKECHRLLRPDGRLVLTTHGIWEEHGSPYDFQRWTANGLRRDLERAGFRRLRIYKITCGLSAMMLFFSRVLFATTAPEVPWRRALFKGFRYAYSKLFPNIYEIAERWWPDQAIVESREDDDGPVWYIVIAAVAEK